MAVTDCITCQLHLHQNLYGWKCLEFTSKTVLHALLAALKVKNDCCTSQEKKNFFISSFHVREQQHSQFGKICLAGLSGNKSLEFITNSLKIQEPITTTYQHKTNQPKMNLPVTITLSSGMGITVYDSQPMNTMVKQWTSYLPYNGLNI